MTKAELNALEKVFAAEIENRLPFQSKAKLFSRLCDEGYLSIMHRTFGSPARLPVTVKGYELTHMGRLAYCVSCEEVPE